MIFNFLRSLELQIKRRQISTILHISLIFIFSVRSHLLVGQLRFIPKNRSLSIYADFEINY